MEHGCEPHELADGEGVGLSARVVHLLETARAAFVADGFAGVSIDEIGRRAGVSKETIYRHFPDKQALFRAALDEMAGRFATRTAALGAGDAPRLADMARAIGDSAVEEGLLSPLWLIAGLGDRMPDFAHTLQLAQWGRLEPLRTALEAHARVRRPGVTVPLDFALDFGSLAVEGPALLLGFPPLSDALRARVAARVAALFEGGLPALDPHGGVWLRPDETPPPPAASPLPHVRRLLDVAAAQFLDVGYEGTNLAALGAAAQVGRGTLYRHFASKDGLFRAVLRDLADQVVRQADVPALLDDAGEAALQPFLAAAIATLAGSPSLELHRAAISASRREPALAREIHDAVRAPWIAPLADWIGARTGLSDARWLARQALVLALQGSRLFATGRRLSVHEAALQAARAAQIMLHGYESALDLRATGA
ncbi:MAG: hypothetical protein RIS94_50 [Pseudomonadota bacterium]